VLKIVEILGVIAAGPSSLSVWKLVQDAGLMVKVVLGILFLFSVWSWTIILWKFFQLRRAKIASEAFIEKFWAADSLAKAYAEAGKFQDSPMAKVFQAGYLELNKVRERRKKIEEPGQEVKMPVRGELAGVENVQRAMNQATTKELNRLTYFLSFLATSGSTSPFIGLFGTVWGIMNSFRRLAVLQSAGLAVVAPGISEALVATAAGLFAAIPAVIFYNLFLTRIQYLESGLNNFSSEFINIIERHYLKKLQSGEAGLL